MTDFEKLGVFYLGKEYDLATRAAKESLLLYDSRDLVTHAVCVGMTGSGKTGLCLSILEEAAIDGIPAIIIDPKGDLPNLLLTFPELQPSDFRPWINEEDAARRGVSADDYAAQQAELWRKGLADWGQDGARIQRLRDAVDIRIYTPGSGAGLPVSILKSFAAPGPAVREDSELMRERVSTTASSLLSLAGVAADPLQSREHILISTVLATAWTQGRDLDLAGLIAQIQTPPFDKVGVLDLESFFSSKERFGLVMALNNLLAAPGFQAWLEGEPLEIQHLLYTPQGKPRLAIFSIAHLNDTERMFFVALLLNQVLGWMRGQSGTTSLRALVYMDEIFGYFPPTANPPSKLPLLTLLKQARAFGLGVVLATQNPVDLDYKGLGNTGTWFIGRLQTERDKQRVLDGLEGAAAGGPFDRSQIDTLISGLGNRVFLMNNVHDNGPAVFTTRWAMSYLRGPLTRSQIKTLMDPVRASVPDAQAATAPANPPAGSPPSLAANAPVVVSAAPAVSAPSPTFANADIQQVYLPARGLPPAGSEVVYVPMVLGAARVNFADAKTRVDTTQDLVLLTPITQAPVPVDWAAARAPDLAVGDLERGPVEGATFADLPGPAQKAKSYTGWQRDFVSHVYGTNTLTLYRHPASKTVSHLGESEGEFRVRATQLSREARDAAVDKLRAKYASRVATAQEKVRRAQQRLDQQQAQASQAGLQTVISTGATVLGALFGRKGSSIGRATTAARGVGRSMKEGGDVNEAKEDLAAARAALAELEAKIAAEADAVHVDDAIEPIAIKAKKSAISVQLLALAWAPHWRDSSGTLTAAW